MIRHSLREHTGADALAVLDRQWRELYAEDDRASYFQSPDWLLAWVQQLPETATPIVLAATSTTGRILAALALVRHGNNVTALSAPHAAYVRPVGPHADTPAVAATFAFHLLLLSQNGVNVDLSDVPATSGLAHALADVGDDSAWQCSPDTATALELPLTPASLSRSAQREHTRLQRTWHRLVADQDLAYTRSRHIRDLLAGFDVLNRLHQPGQWPGHAASAQQWRAVLDHIGAADAFVATLSVDRTIVAAQLGVVRGRHCTVLLSALAFTARHLGPDHALLRHLARDLAGEGFTALTLGRAVHGRHTYQHQRQPVWASTLTASSIRLAPAV
ncbi:GNAT family N-acetyltransferase [Streptomyces minutiscleroticus]|uniref:GNAT family N-acetyltransferase n=1 Tax=Streptomyces minutiscleroticus TaxID=68238 RepID=UPI003322C32D